MKLKPFLKFFIVVVLLLVHSISFSSEGLSEKLKSALEELFTPKRIEVYINGSAEDPFFKDIYVEAEDAKTSGLPIERVKIEAIDAKLNPSDEWERGNIKVEKVKDVRLLMTITEEGLNSFLRDKIKDANEHGLKKAYVRIKKDKFILAASYQLGGLPIRVLVELAGKLKIKGSKIYLADYKFYVGGLKMRKEFTSRILRKVNPILDLRTLPFPVRDGIIEQEEGKITIRTKTLPQKPDLLRRRNNPNPSHIGNQRFGY
ncbi:MAG: DUF2993 domain-containing protein [Synergistetes bacterium]|nr:DUF2993 domain-containing protein [Synergistota bacterium]